MSKSDVGTGQMQQAQIIERLLLPADQKPTETVEPAMGPLHDPTTRLVPGFLLNGRSLLSPRANVGGEAKLSQQSPHLIIVIASIQTHPLLLSALRLRTGLGPLDRDA